MCWWRRRTSPRPSPRRARDSSDHAANAARKKALTALEQSCEQASAKSRSGKLKCQAVSLYEGGQYFLYKYKRYDDVRLVFTPETDIAAFGGDPDNFQFPRWSLDFAMLRAYENGKPAEDAELPADRLCGAAARIELVFVSGHPGSTSRLETRAQLEFERDVSLPPTLLRTSELRGGYIQFGRANQADMQLIEGPLNSLENCIKVRRKLLDALHDDDLMARKKADEDTLRAARKPAGARSLGANRIGGGARARACTCPTPSSRAARDSTRILFRYARLLLRASRRARQAERRATARIYRLHRCRASNSSSTRACPSIAEVETLTLSFSLQRMREWLGPDYPLVRRLLARESPGIARDPGRRGDEARRCRRAQAALGRRQGRHRRLARSHDRAGALDRRRRPRLAQAIRRRGGSADHRRDRPRSPTERFKAFGTQVYPDANFTLRLNYGTVTGWTRDGAAVEPFTYLGRAFERATGAGAVQDSRQLDQVKDHLDMRTPFCISTNNDIVGGNSGSPLIDAEGRMVGLMFDGNIDSIAGTYWFDAAKNRAVAVHPAIIREALEQVYGAKALLAELGAS